MWQHNIISSKIIKATSDFSSLRSGSELSQQKCSAGFFFPCET